MASSYEIAMRSNQGITGLPGYQKGALIRILRNLFRRGRRSPMDKARRLSPQEKFKGEFDLDVYHGTPEDIKGPFRESRFAPELGYGEIGSGVYVSPNPKSVRRYTTNARDLHPSDPNVTTGSIHPLKVRSKKLLSSDSPEWKELLNDVIHNDPWFTTKTPRTDPYFQPGGWGYTQATERARKLAKEMGWEGFYRPKKDWIDGRWVTRSLDPKDADEIVIFDPKNLRSRWAVFDPAQAGSANIGAGVAGLLATGAVRGQRERE